VAAASAAARGGGGGGGDRGMPAQVVGQGKGVVKFFNASKGFGFIQRDEGGEDVFVHISAVERAGLEGLAEGQQLEFTLVDRGGKVSASDLAGRRRCDPRRKARGAAARADWRAATGTVKFFNAMKGFGFITRDDGQPTPSCTSARSSVRACRASTKATGWNSISRSIDEASTRRSTWCRVRVDPDPHPLPGFDRSLRPSINARNGGP
jgi:cold shock CspA family protein